MTYGIPYEIVKYLSVNHDVTTREARKSVENVLNTITVFLSKDKSVTFRDFGTLELSKWSEREFKNPKTGKNHKVDASYRPIFKAGKKLKILINAAAEKEENKDVP